VYLAGVFEALINTTQFAVTIGGLILGGINLVILLYNSELLQEDRKPYITWPAYVLVSVLFLSIFVPSKQTMMMIAASESIGYATKTEIGQDLYEVLKKELKKAKESK
jgi:hypothetical protein